MLQSIYHHHHHHHYRRVSPAAVAGETRRLLLSDCRCGRSVLVAAIGPSHAPAGALHALVASFQPQQP